MPRSSRCCYSEMVQGRRARTLLLWCGLLILVEEATAMTLLPGKMTQPAPGHSPGPPRSTKHGRSAGEEVSGGDDRKVFSVTFEPTSGEVVGGSTDNDTWWSIADPCSVFSDNNIPMEPGSDQHVNISVRHHLFKTDAGLVAGVTYQVFVNKMASKVHQIFLTTFVAGKARGVILSGSNSATFCPGREASILLDMDESPAVSFNWTVRASENESNVAFRLRYRLVTGRTIYKIQFILPLLKDCFLFLGEERTNISWWDVRGALSLHPDCYLFFPTAGNKGLLLDLQRLNIVGTRDKCYAGFIQFGDPGNTSLSRRFCGKLEEYQDSERSLYYPRPPAMMRVHCCGFRYSSHAFLLSYRFVDYCFNLTLTAPNGSLEVASDDASRLHCTFRIHLPYGYRISLRLEMGDLATVPAESRTTSTSILQNTIDQWNNRHWHSKTAVTSCPGLTVRVWNGKLFRAYCSMRGDVRHSEDITSDGNRLVLNVDQGDSAPLAPPRISYVAFPNPEVVQQCEFGWVSVHHFCVTVVDAEALGWNQSEAQCVRLGGHLASIRSEQAQVIIDNLLFNSPGYRDHNSYWIGATDKEYEGDFRWTDGLPFTYTNWFSGWPQRSMENAQPNDDGFSDQDCVELRRSYRLTGSEVGFTDSFTWNDRDCSVSNFYLCEKLRTGESIDDSWPECNRSVVLSREQSRATVVSPGFPEQYPDNAECETEIIAPPGFRVVLDFEELVLEEEAECNYDYLEIIEAQPIQPRNQSSPSPPVRLCGDRSRRLKLYHYVSRDSRLRLRFVSDFSHHYGGFKARVSMENVAMECEDDHLRMFNSSCYLFVSYPEVTWDTAQQICKEMKANLASVLSLEEENFITANIRELEEYTTSAIYWLGGKLVTKQRWEWADGSPMKYNAWFPSHRIPKANDTCLGVQWFSSARTLSSGLYWQPKRCDTSGGYVCKRRLQALGSTLDLNKTINGSSGILTSPNFPGNYNNNLNYWVRIVGPDRTRVIVRFSKLDLEHQDDCLYDFVALRSGDMGPETHYCGSQNGNTERFTFVSESNVAVLRFHSDYSSTGSGFEAKWEAVDVSGCPFQTLTAKEGSLQSPNFPDFLLSSIECSTTILAPVGRSIWLEFTDFDLGWGDSGSELQTGGRSEPEAVLELDLGGETKSFRPFQSAGKVTDGVYLSSGQALIVRLKTGVRPQGRGFRAIYRTLREVKEEREIDLHNVTSGLLMHLNHPAPVPSNVNFVQHLIAPVGHVIFLELYNVTVVNRSCPGGQIEIKDNFADSNGTEWYLCQSSDPAANLFAVTSYLNTIHVSERTGSGKLKLNGSFHVQEDPNFKLKLLKGMANSWVESCRPSHCLNNGRCVSRGLSRRCQCTSNFTGMFCALSLCDLEPCGNGWCELTSSGYRCQCQPGYTGRMCKQKQNPCAENPCEGRGECSEQGNSFHCRCYAWFEGPLCERKMIRIPQKPLSTRMLQEPFWLGLITVFVVMGVIGLFWCAKRHVPEKLEKLLAEEADRNRTSTLPHGRAPSVRDQLSSTGAAVAPSPQPCPRTLFGRLGSPSPRKKRNNSTPTKKNIAEKKQILQQLVTPPVAQKPRKVSLGELIQLSEKKAQAADKKKEEKEGEEKETEFSGQPVPPQSIRPEMKLEKKVTFAKLLDKVSAEISSSSPDIMDPPRSSSTPPSPAFEKCTHFSLRRRDNSPNSTSSNQGSGSDIADISSSDTLATPDLCKRRLLGPGKARVTKISSADSILAMFRNFTSSKMSGSTPSSPQGSDGEDSSGFPTPLSTPDSPLFSASAAQSSNTIEVPVLDALSAQKTAVNCNLLHPPTILLEIPMLDYSKCLSPIKEVPTPLSTPSPSPVPTPLLSRGRPELYLISAAPDSDEDSDGLKETSIRIEVIEPGPKGAFVVPQISITAVTSEEEPDEVVSTKNGSRPLKDDVKIMIEKTDNISVSSKSLSSPKVKMKPPPLPPPLIICNDVDPIPSGPGIKEPEPITLMDEAIPSPLLDNKAPVVISPLLGCKEPVPARHHSQITVHTALEPADVSSVCKSGKGCDNDEGCPSSPIIPLLTISVPSPTKSNPLLRTHILGSPPPRRLSLAHEKLPSGLTGHDPTIVESTAFCFPSLDPGQAAQVKNKIKGLSKRLLKDFDKPNSLDLPCGPPVITVTTNMSEAESDTDSPIVKTTAGMSYLSPFSMCSRADRTASESNLSSSGYSSMASPGPSRCGSNNPLCPSEVEDPPTPGATCGPNLHPPQVPQVWPRRPSPLLRTPNIEDDGQTTGNQTAVRNPIRCRSDSETLSDDLMMEPVEHDSTVDNESNDEGIGTDHLEERIEDGELKSAKELQVFIGKELENGKTLNVPIIELGLQAHTNLIQKSLSLESKQPQGKKTLSLKGESLDSKLGMASLQLPAIVVQSDSATTIVDTEKHLSPVSSRSESPLSDKMGFGRFSPLFYGKNKTELPYTDSDGLYDCPSSEVLHSDCPNKMHRKSGRRRERRNSTRARASKSPSPTKPAASPTILLEVPCKDRSPRKPSPKRRIRSQPSAKVSSSSSSESLTSSNRDVSVKLSSSEKSPSPEKGWVGPPTEGGWEAEVKVHVSTEASGEDTAEDTNNLAMKKLSPRDELPKPHRKICRMRTIGHQIRFLRRLEMSLKRRERLVSPSDSVESDDSPPSSPNSSSSLIDLKKNKGRVRKAKRRGEQPLLQDEPVSSWSPIPSTG